MSLPGEAPYIWRLGGEEAGRGDVSDLALDINVSHPLYQQVAAHGKGPLHRLHVAWLVSVALAERTATGIAPVLEEYLESLTKELYNRWASPRGET
jgi:hypothetical protein